MITDEQGREWLLQKFYDDGWLYYYKAGNGCMYLSKRKPAFRIGSNEIDPNSGGTTKCTDALVGLIPEMQLNEVLDITKELGLIDWSKVPVDTPIYVRKHENNTWEKRHFAFFKNGRVYSWLSGVTSWTAEDNNYVFSWKYAKLVEV